MQKSASGFLVESKCRYAGARNFLVTCLRDDESSSLEPAVVLWRQMLNMAGGFCSFGKVGTRALNAHPAKRRLRLHCDDLRRHFIGAQSGIIEAPRLEAENPATLYAQRRVLSTSLGPRALALRGAQAAGGFSLAV